MTKPESIDESSMQDWLEELGNGKSRAIERLWNLYFQRMVALASRKLAGMPTAARDEEDLALSAFKSFCLSLRDGRRALDQNKDDLWPLLVSITLNKVIDQIRANNRVKRGGGNSRKALDVLTIDELGKYSQSPEMEIVTEDLIANLLLRLDAQGDPNLRLIVTAKLTGQSNEEIASYLNSTVRTVQRKLTTARSVWEQRTNE